MKSPRVSVIIPTFNGSHLLQKFLPAVIEQLRSGDELILVDDASTDDTLVWLNYKFNLKPVEDQIISLPVAATLLEDSSSLYRIKVLQLHQNSRFAAAVNYGVASAQNELLFLLNNDVEPGKNCLKVLAAHFSDTSVFGVGTIEYDSKLKKTIPSGRNSLWFAEGIFQHARLHKEQHELGDTAWVSGGSGMFDREKWLLIGGFDTLFHPAYWEDVDLSFRARKQGWKVLFDPAAVVYHHHETTNATTFGEKKIQKISWKNGDAFTWKNGTIWQKLQFLLWRPVWFWRRLKA